MIIVLIILAAIIIFIWSCLKVSSDISRKEEQDELSELVKETYQERKQALKELKRGK